MPRTYRQEWRDWECPKQKFQNMDSIEFDEENEAVNCILQVVCRNKIAYLPRKKTDRDTKRRRKDVPQANNTAQVWNTLLREEECSEYSAEIFDRRRCSENLFLEMIRFMMRI